MAAFLFCACCLTASAQSLEDKLERTTDYVPKAGTAVDQLVEIARKFKLPMAIEWIEKETSAGPALERKSAPDHVDPDTVAAPDSTDPDPVATTHNVDPDAVPAPDNVNPDTVAAPDNVQPDAVPRLAKACALVQKKRSIRELIQEVAGDPSDYTVEVGSGLVHIFSPSAASNSLNSLNIRLKSYGVTEGDLFAAEDQLRWAIRFTLEPEKYKNGYNGGHGHGTPDVFDFPKFTLSESNVTIREVLNKIAVAQGNALWLTTIKDDEVNRKEPYWKGNAVDDGEAPLTSRWRFMSLAEISDLAKDQVAVDVAVEDFGPVRVASIPLILEHGLVDYPGDAMAIYSGGNSFSCQGRIDEIEIDGITLSTHLTIKRRGEIDKEFERKFRVVQGEVAEFSEVPWYSLRAFFEPRNESNQDVSP